MSFNDMTNEQVVARYGGTTWERIQDRYLVAAGSNHTVNTTGGSSTVTLTTDNLPSHSHSYTNTIVGSNALTINQIPKHHHAINNGANGGAGNDGYGVMYNIEAIHGDHNWWNFSDATMYSSYVGGSGSHTHSDISQSKTTGTTGSGTAVNIEPPYIAIYMWRRTA